VERALASRPTRARAVERALWERDGVQGGYEITLQQSSRTPPFTGALLIGQPGSGSHEKHGYNWSTTSHLHHVGVPAPLTIAKPAGEPTTFVLQKSGDAINVVELR
jgi:hypothetical protein